MRPLRPSPWIRNFDPTGVPECGPTAAAQRAMETRPIVKATKRPRLARPALPRQP